MLARLLWVAVALCVLGALPTAPSARAPRVGASGVVAGVGVHALDRAAP